MTDHVAGPIATVVPRLWAQRKVAELSIFADENKEKLLEIGRRFGFVTPGASLLVLTDLSQVY